jgi:hypothetical protein
MWPAYRLNDSDTYVVGYRNLSTTFGTPVLPSAAFAALRDNLSSSDPTVDARRNLYNNVIFPTLASAGGSRRHAAVWRCALAYCGRRGVVVVAMALPV